VRNYKNKLTEFKRRSEQGQKEYQNYIKEIQRAKAHLKRISPQTVSSIKSKANRERLAKLQRLNQTVRRLVNKTKENIAVQRRVNAQIAKTVNNFFGRH
jgi:archaellum component FlaC